MWSKIFGVYKISRHEQFLLMAMITVAMIVIALFLSTVLATMMLVRLF
jgi:hypothetical protein